MEIEDSTQVNLCFLAVMSLRSSHKSLSFPLDGKGPKDQGRLNRTSARLSKRLTFRSRMFVKSIPPNQRM